MTMQVSKLKSGSTFEYNGKRYMRQRGVQRGQVFASCMEPGSGWLSDGIYLPKTTLVEGVDETTGLTKQQERET